MDHQVKIRGYRIELGEIESALVKHESIKAAVVTIVGDKQLCAYIVSRGESGVSVPQLRDYLSRHLPGYMIPSFFMFVEGIPLTPNGKIDRRSLPVPEVEKSDVYEAPGNEAEEKMVEIWSEILGIEKEVIGVHDDFFERGGNSLKVTTLAARIHEVFQVEVPIGEIFQNPTVKGICRLISVIGWVRETELSDNLQDKEEIVL
jgi:hybrid polyketide synthase/nonribosomal peptide synthetase FtdB